MNANYNNLKRGVTISNGDNFGTIDEALFGMVLINWQGINPAPLPPIFYPADVWDFRFGSNYTICEEANNDAAVQHAGECEIMNGDIHTAQSTSKITLNVKDSDLFSNLAYDLKYESFVSKHGLDKESDETIDRFYNDVIKRYFEYGEYATIEIEVNNNFEIVGGKIIEQS